MYVQFSDPGNHSLGASNLDNLQLGQSPQVTIKLKSVRLLNQPYTKCDGSKAQITKIDPHKIPESREFVLVLPFQKAVEKVSTHGLSIQRSIDCRCVCLR